MDELIPVSSGDDDDGDEADTREAAKVLAGQMPGGEE